MAYGGAMGHQETVVLTREQLYDLVWSKPMTVVAADFGMSDVAFAKHCKKLNAPVPWRGYWQRVEHGFSGALVVIHCTAGL